MSSATDLGRCVYEVPELGVVHEIRDVWYDNGLGGLAERGASFLDYTARTRRQGRALDLRQPALELSAEMSQWGDSWDAALARLCRAERELLAP